MSKKVNVSNQALVKATGKDRKEWFAILDSAKIDRKNHKEIVGFLKENYNLSPWWRQMLTVIYEQEKGYRKIHQMKEGFQISKSRTFNFDVADIYKSWTNKRSRNVWLKDPEIEIRKANENKSLRITWSDKESDLDVYFYPKENGKTQLVVNHKNLKSPKDAERMKKYWAENIDNLKNYLSKNFKERATI